MLAHCRFKPHVIDPKVLKIPQITEDLMNPWQHAAPTEELPGGRTRTR